MAAIHGTDSASLRRAAAPRVLLEAEVFAHGSTRLSRDEIAAERRRREPLAEGWNPIGHGTLRNSDEQTVAAVASLRGAIARAGRPAADFDGWGVLAAPRFLGRSKLTVAFDQFKAEGVWGVTPHLIPHFALHAQAGTLSLILGGHGPNLGIGGGRFAASEGVLSALTWLESGVAPGVWLVLTGWSPEYRPDRQGEPLAETHCESVALALIPASSDQEGRIKLQINELETPGPPSPTTPETLAARLDGLLASPMTGPREIAHRSHAARRFGLDGRPGKADRRIALGTDDEGRLLIDLKAPGGASA